MIQKVVLTIFVISTYCPDESFPDLMMRTKLFVGSNVPQQGHNLRVLEKSLKGGLTKHAIYKEAPCLLVWLMWYVKIHKMEISIHR